MKSRGNTCVSASSRFSDGGSIEEGTRHVRKYVGLWNNFLIRMWQKSAVNSGWNRCIVATQVPVTISPLYLRKVYCLFVSSIEGLPQIPTTMSSSTTQMNRMLTNVKKHPLYYHANMDLTIIVRFHSDCCWTWVLIWTLKVADTCFCQPSYFFTRESPVFRDRLAGDTSKTDAMNCTKHDSANSDVSVKHTIVIEPHENVSPDDFAELCSIFDNPYATANTSFCLRLMSRQEVYKLQQVARIMDDDTTPRQSVVFPRSQSIGFWGAECFRTILIYATSAANRFLSEV